MMSVDSNTTDDEINVGASCHIRDRTIGFGICKSVAVDRFLRRFDRGVAYTGDLILCGLLEVR
jgi:hypothetical protein